MHPGPAATGLQMKYADHVRRAAPDSDTSDALFIQDSKTPAMPSSSVMCVLLSHGGRGPPRMGTCWVEMVRSGRNRYWALRADVGDSEQQS